MNDASLEALIEYRLHQAGETLQEADGLYQMSLWRGAINRSYYAMFYAILALTVLRQQAISKHSGVIAFFDREFVRTGIFSKELSRSLHRTFESRQNNDYGEIFTVNDEEAKQSIESAHTFVGAVENYIRSTFS
ncbi:MAG: HEPN domain-containing protein [Chloroflexota bacterium]